MFYSGATKHSSSILALRGYTLLLASRTGPRLIIPGRRWTLKYAAQAKQHGEFGNGSGGADMGGLPHDADYRAESAIRE